ncbi:MAG: FAD-binding protein [Chloroflexi bacterium]|nr:FAD-binding protein [Chloroflexota bacterium]
MGRSTMELRNWAGNIRFSTDRLHHPETVDQVQEIVRTSRQVRVLGSRHSFNAIADSTGDLISLDRLEPVLEIDEPRRQITIDGGVTYGQLAPRVCEAGFALHNTASLPHITVAGACATATHGPGSANGILGSRVAAMQIVTGDGSVRTMSRAEDGDRFGGVVVGLGGLGVVTRLTLDVSPTFDMSQLVYENLPLAEVDGHFDAIMSSGYSVSLFTDWRERRFNQVWIKTVAASGDAAEAAPTFYGATLATTDVHPLPTLDAAACTPQMGVVGPWHERLPHFRAEFEPSFGEELQSEYFVPRAQAGAALRAIADIRGDVAPLLQMSEVRTIAADDLWMSPFYRRDSVALHFTWRYDWENLKLLLPRIEKRLAPFDPRPHWGKLFTMPAPRLQACYARLPDFRALLESFDPQGTFRNTFLETMVFG